MRRATNPTRKISITIPDSIFQRLNHILSYEQSRSSYIANAIKSKMDNEDALSFDELDTMDLLYALQFRFYKDSAEDVLIQSLLNLCRHSES